MLDWRYELSELSWLTTKHNVHQILLKLIQRNTRTRTRACRRNLKKNDYFKQMRFKVLHGHGSSTLHTYGFEHVWLNTFLKVFKNKNILLELLVTCHKSILTSRENYLLIRRIRTNDDYLISCGLNIT